MVCLSSKRWDAQVPNIPHNRELERALVCSSDAHQEFPNPLSLISSPTEAFVFDGGGVGIRTRIRLYVRVVLAPQSRVYERWLLCLIKVKCLNQFGHTPISQKLCLTPIKESSISSDTWYPSRFKLVVKDQSIIVGASAFQQLTEMQRFDTYVLPANRQEPVINSGCHFYLTTFLYTSCTDLTWVFSLAAGVGLEPTTTRLTGEGSTD